MEQPQGSLLHKLIEIGKIDAALARIAAEKKKIETNLQNQKVQLKKLLTEKEARSKLLEEKRTRYQKEEKSLKEEREKLIARRKALSTNSNYKLQQAAGREIDHASKQLESREETLLTVVDEMDAIDKDCQEKQAGVDQLKTEHEKAMADAQDTFATFEERKKEYSLKRDEFTSGVDAGKLATYERVHERFPMDPVAFVNGQSCSGCFMQVAPQLTVEISRGDSIVKCRGCGRILFMGTSSGENPENATNK